MEQLTGLQKALRAAGKCYGVDEEYDEVERLCAVLQVARSTVLKWLREDGTPLTAPAALPDNAVAEAVGKAGSQAALARELGVTYQAVKNWVRLGYTPPQRAQQIENTYGISRASLVSPKLRSAMGIGGEL